MNEELKTHYILALEYAYSKVPEKHRYNDIFYSIVAGKFAELIIKEGVKILHTEMFRLDALQGREIQAQSMETAAMMLKKHFGVEE